MKKSILFFALAAFVVACGGTSSDKPAATTASSLAATDAPDGEKLYKTYCVTCHGLYGDMGASGANDLTKSALSMEERITIISEGRPNTLMVGFSASLDEAKIKAIAEYTLKLKK